MPTRPQVLRLAAELGFKKRNPTLQEIAMVHGYHVILSSYGFWLPNDARSSWSAFVGSWELLRFGPSTKGMDFRHLAQLTPEESRTRQSMLRCLKYPPVEFNKEQVSGIARGFAAACNQYGYVIWACSILPQHTHLVVARHRYKVELVANKLKSKTSSQLIEENLHPLIQFAEPSQRPPRMWGEGQWQSFLDSERAIEDAIAYVIDNPIKEGKPRQTWDFVTPFAGLDSGWLTYLE